MASKILIVPKGFFGDLILITPMIAALKRADPESRISVLCAPSAVDIVRRDPLVSEVIVYDKKGEHRGWRGVRRMATRIREEGFAVAYSTQRAARIGVLLRLAGVPKRVGFSDSSVSFLYSHLIRKPHGAHDVVRNLMLVEPDLDLRTRDELLRLVASSDVDVPWADLRVGRCDSVALSPHVREWLAGGRFVVIAPGSAWATKRWTPKGFQEVAAALIKEGTRVVVVGAPADATVCDLVAREPGVVNFCGRTTIGDLVELIAAASSLVCNDSFGLHIASAVKTPVTVVFCATSPRFGFGPWRVPAAIVEKGDLFCKPCRRHGSRRCPTGTNSCMTGVSSDEVLVGVRKLVLSAGDYRKRHEPADV